ncbi:reverse transcriptase domain-containing protein [Tanacetum coccineum]
MSSTKLISSVVVVARRGFATATQGSVSGSVRGSGIAMMKKATEDSKKSTPWVPDPLKKIKGAKTPRGNSLAVPWSCEDVDPFTPRIRNFRSSRKTRIPNNVKTYDGTGDPEDHLKVFQASANIDITRIIKSAFLAYFIATEEAFETGRMKGALECMKISGFMHGVNNPELMKRLNEHVPKTLSGER